MSEEAENTIAAAIDGAEDICNPLDGLTDRIAVDPGAPFAAETLRHLAALKAEDRAVFEALRAQLKRAGVRVTALDEAPFTLISAKAVSSAAWKSSAGAESLTNRSAWVGPRPERPLNSRVSSAIGHRETWPIRSKGFRRWLARLFFDAAQGAPNSEALQSALNCGRSKTAGRPRTGGCTSKSGQRSLSSTVDCRVVRPRLSHSSAALSSG